MKELIIQKKEPRRRLKKGILVGSSNRTNFFLSKMFTIEVHFKTNYKVLKYNLKEK